MYTNKQIWSVSYPILLSLLAQNVINVTDTAFLGHVSEVALGASAMGGLFYICVFTIAFGFSTGSQIVIARRNGEGRYTDVGPVMIQGVMFLFVMALLLFGFTKAFGGNIMRLLVSSESIYKGTMEFLDWRIYGFFFSFINVMFRALYIGITRTKVLTINAVVMALTNVVLDYALIFGKFGLPEMGIKGAAIASVLAEASSILFFLIYTYVTIDLKKYGLNRLRSFDPALLMRILSISCFTMLQYFLSMATWFVFFVAVERLGQRELAIANIVRSIYVVLLIPVNSLATTTNSLVSNAIGAGGAGCGEDGAASLGGGRLAVPDALNGPVGLQAGKQLQRLRADEAGVGPAGGCVCLAGDHCLCRGPAGICDLRSGSGPLLPGDDGNRLTGG